MTGTGPGSPTRVALDVSAIPTQAQGAGNYVLELARALRHRDDVALTCLARRDDTARWGDATGGPVAGIAPSGRVARVAYGELLLGWRAGRVAGSPEVFHGPHYTLPHGLRLPGVVTVHDLLFVTHPEWHERSKVAYFTRAIERSARRAAVLVCVSERTRAELLERFRPRGEVLVAPHGIDAERFSPDEPAEGADAAVLARHRIEGPYVLHVGTIEPRKDLPGLIEAFDEVARDRPGLQLVLAGRRGWGTETLDEAVAAARASVLELGFVEVTEVAALMRRAAVVAYPSRAEGFGLPALEALATGVPLVTTSDSAMSDLAGEAALTVAAGDHAALAAAIESCMTDSAGVARRRGLGLELAAHATWEASANVHAAAYRLAAGH